MNGSVVYCSSRSLRKKINRFFFEIKSSRILYFSGRIRTVEDLAIERTKFAYFKTRFDNFDNRRMTDIVSKDVCVGTSDLKTDDVINSIVWPRFEPIKENEKISDVFLNCNDDVQQSMSLSSQTVDDSHESRVEYRGYDADDYNDDCLKSIIMIDGGTSNATVENIGNIENGCIDNVDTKLYDGESNIVSDIIKVDKQYIDGHRKSMENHFEVNYEYCIRLNPNLTIEPKWNDELSRASICMIPKYIQPDENEVITVSNFTFSKDFYEKLYGKSRIGYEDRKDYLNLPVISGIGDSISDDKNQSIFEKLSFFFLGCRVNFDSVSYEDNTISNLIVAGHYDWAAAFMYKHGIGCDPYDVFASGWCYLELVKPEYWVEYYSAECPFLTVGILKKFLQNPEHWNTRICLTISDEMVHVSRNGSMYNVHDVMDCLKRSYVFHEHNNNDDMTLAFSQLEIAYLRLSQIEQNIRIEGFFDIYSIYRKIDMDRDTYYQLVYDAAVTGGDLNEMLERSGLDPALCYRSYSTPYYDDIESYGSDNDSNYAESLDSWYYRSD